MRLWNEGDRSRGVCPRCKKRVATVFERRTVHLDEPRPIDVPNVLVEACGACGEALTIPPQSTPRFRKARGEAERVAVRIPALLEDAVSLIAQKYEARSAGFASAIVRHYLRRIAKDGQVAQRVGSCLASPLGSTAPAESRVTLRVSKEALDAAIKSAGLVGVERRSRLIRGILVLAAIDAGVVADGDLAPSSGADDSLEALAAAAE